MVRVYEVSASHAERTAAACRSIHATGNLGKPF